MDQCIKSIASNCIVGGSTVLLTLSGEWQILTFPSQYPERATDKEHVCMYIELESYSGLCVSLANGDVD